MSVADDYCWAERDERLDAFCLTVVAGVDEDGVVVRFGGSALTEVQATFGEAFNGYPSPSYVLVGTAQGGVVAMENNGWRGVQHDVACNVSLGGQVGALYRSVNADMTFVHAVDGGLVCEFDPLLDDVPAELATAAEGLPFGVEHVIACSLALLERLTRVRLESNWLDEPHRRFDVPSPD